MILSRSLNYFSKITPALLLGSFVKGAQISISDGTTTKSLKEFSLKSQANIDLSYYSMDSTGADAYIGQLGKAYTLQINVDGVTYTASTTIPQRASTVDSLWWKKSLNNPDVNKVLLKARVTDPPGYGNYIRYYTQVGKGPFLPGLNSVFDDQIIDGTAYEVSVDRGVDRNEEIDIETYAFFNLGDTVSVKFCNIDRATYDFWRTMEFSYSSIGNPFSSPTKVLGNIQGGALGYFGGYATQFRTLIIRK